MPKKILVVEDHPDSRNIMVLLLRKMAYEAIEAADGEEAVLKAITNCPDLIIMDLGLPKISGIEAAVRIKQNPQAAHIPIIAHTAWSEERYKGAALEAGMVGYLTKPTSPQRFRETVERFLNPDAESQIGAKR